MSDRAPRVAIVLVNWKAWADTIECVESALRLDYPDFQIIVCDNGSSDGSVERLEAWAHGDDVWPGPAVADMARYSTPPRPKPLKLVVRDRDALPDDETREADVVVIGTGGNLGFAGGNNVGIRFALAEPETAYVWLLNNDTVVLPDTLRHLVDRARQHPQPGPCGATLRFYHRPHTVQARGGSRFNSWTAQSRCIGIGTSAETTVDAAEIERSIDFVVGASLMVSRTFLETVGLMEEGYFLYFEEIDWATRAGSAFPPVYAPKAIVYHKEGGSIGSTATKGQRSGFSEFYLARSKLLFTRKFYPLRLPVTYASSLFQVARRVQRGHWQKARLILRALAGAGTP